MEGPTALRRRRGGVELLDAGEYTLEEMRGNLADLRRFNRWFGGTAMARRWVERLWRESGAPNRLTLLDVATGSADLPAAMALWGRSRGVTVAALGLDENPDVLREAAAATGGAGPARVALVRGLAGALPLADRSIDVVLCCTFLHHLDEEGALTAALAEMRRVARLGVIAIDLTRSRPAAILVGLATRLTSANRLTRHDGPMSVARSLTPKELAEAAAEAGLDGAQVRREGPVRMVLYWRRGATGSAPSRGGS